MNRAQDAELTEHCATVTYEAQVFVNSVSGRKATAKAIMNVVDTKMLGMGFNRIMNNPIRNTDPAIARRIARWRAVASSDGRIYRK